ncbi:exo-beta-1,3-glucanase [Cordyceps militaris CM01]|uniref:Exo-beta-1,3-glucanase n=1 Tax=Cordyceps militaris (strain CM01) TaxID=983644 RepID=G3JGF2_CORMM|nr:exo-beta-1,3-glucanase [Cordyceps militaris CM01]EGX92369.1 exo-beta-1,3-glucanase [Cordyceps militaris CM01]
MVFWCPGVWEQGYYNGKACEPCIKKYLSFSKEKRSYREVLRLNKFKIILYSIELNILLPTIKNSPFFFIKLFIYIFLAIIPLLTYLLVSISLKNNFKRVSFKYYLVVKNIIIIFNKEKNSITKSLKILAKTLIFKLITILAYTLFITVGILTENGSGGFISDLTFNSGNIIKGGSIAFNISSSGGLTGQGIKSVSIIDSEITNVEVSVLTNSAATAPNIILNNTKFTSATGKQYNGDKGSTKTGNVKAPARSKGLNNENGKLYVRSRPQYKKKSTGDFLITTTDSRCKNNASGNQAGCLNRFLSRAVEGGKIAYFPANVYTVGSTVYIPVGSIQGSGFFFSDITKPKVIVQVGKKGDDSHFHIGGALGTDLNIATCPRFSNKAANHDNDQSIVNQPNSSITQISIFAARSTLIESKVAPRASTGHIQTEAPYYQLNPRPPNPFHAGAHFPNNPDFSGYEVAAV